MLKKTITYTDYNGVERTEDFYFNLSATELVEMEYGGDGASYTDMIQKIIAAKDLPSLIKVFKELLLKSYGEKSADGKRFVKSKELSEAFSQTEAYSTLFLQLASNDELASEFVEGIIPQNLSTKIIEFQPGSSAQ